VVERRNPLVGVENGDETHFRDVEPLAEQVDADEYVDVAQAEVANDLVSFEGIRLVVHVRHVDSGFLEVLREILGHPLSERGGDQDALVALDPLVDPFEEVLDLSRCLRHLHLRVDEVGRANDLFGDPVGGLALVVVARRRRNVERAVRLLLELLEGERAVVVRGREPEPVLDQRILSRFVALVLSLYLRDRLWDSSITVRKSSGK